MVETTDGRFQQSGGVAVTAIDNILEAIWWVEISNLYTFQRVSLSNLKDIRSDIEVGRERQLGA